MATCFCASWRDTRGLSHHVAPMGTIDWFEGWWPQGGAGVEGLPTIVARAATRVRCRMPTERKIPQAPQRLLLAHAEALPDHHKRNRARAALVLDAEVSRPRSKGKP